MTESEWLACEDSALMLGFLGESASPRKLRLFACACCRRAWNKIAGRECADSLEVAERFAEGMADPADLEKAWMAAADAADHAPWKDDEVESAVCDACDKEAWMAARHSPPGLVNALTAPRDERAIHASLLRCIFGDRFRDGVSIARTTTILSLAQAAYDERALPSGYLDTARLGVLSDALEEAGCTDDAILSHLRSPGPHVRGCWPLDLILAKE